MTAPTKVRHRASTCGADWARVIWELAQLASVETYLHNHQHALELQIEARDTAQRYGAYSEVLDIQQDVASTLRAMGRLDEAKEQFYELIPHALEYNEQQRLMTLTDDYAAILTDVGDQHSSVHFLGAADAMRERLAIPRMRTQREASEQTLAKSTQTIARKTLTRTEVSTNRKATWVGRAPPAREILSYGATPRSTGAGLWPSRRASCR